MSNELEIFVVTSVFLRWQILFFQLNLVFIADINVGFCSEPFLKYGLNLRYSHWNFFIKKVFLEISRFSKENTCVAVSLK